MSSLTIPKLVEIANTMSLRRRTGAPVPVEKSIGLGLVANPESVASLQRIVLDVLNVLPYFPGLNHTMEGDHVGTGRISSGLYRGQCSC